MIQQLIKKFENYNMTNESPLTLTECFTLLENEIEVPYDVFQDVMDYKDHLEMENE